MLSDAEIDILISQMYAGEISSYNLPIWAYQRISKILLDGVNEGFGTIGIKYNSTDFKAIQSLQDNVRLFSGAKTFNYVYDTENLMVENGKILPFKEFQERARVVGVKYGQAWLESEYYTTLNQSKNCKDELSLFENEEYFPLARYVAYIDANTAEICKAVNGIVKPIRDSFWDSHSPAQHYKCRCHKEPLEEGEAKISKTPKNLPKKSDLFGKNMGKTQEVWSEKHPYFTEIPKEYKSFAKTNFNLPI